MAPFVAPPKPALNLETLKTEAKKFIAAFGNKHPELFGVTDGKAVGTYVEAKFNVYLKERYVYTQGNAANGIDFPELGVDVKATSIKQPQSSCPFKSAEQKVYGLGYNLLVFVYDKHDDSIQKAAIVDFKHIVFVRKDKTADFQTTRGILEILNRDGNKDDLIGYLDERNLPLEEIGRNLLAERILNEKPQQGYLTISNALQWRLQYGRVITVAAAG
ncbi:MAG TPA: restriction endonuclease, partial [Candidatus Angelobacter sp.]|nr:restriction endonuclease [Candidatus Angelobacter sp.]